MRVLHHVAVEVRRAELERFAVVGCAGAGLRGSSWSWLHSVLIVRLVVVRVLVAVHVRVAAVAMPAWERGRRSANSNAATCRPEASDTREPIHTQLPFDLAPGLLPIASQRESGDVVGCLLRTWLYDESRPR